MSERDSSTAAALSGAWRRWKAASLNPATSATTQPAADTPAPEVVDPRVILEQWKRQAESEGHALGLRRGLEEGRQQGHAAGHAAGLAEAQTLLGEEKQRLRELIETSSQALEQMHADLGQATLALALQIARDLLRSELSAQPQQLLPLVREVLQNQSRSAPLSLWLNPDDLDLVQQHLSQELSDSDCRLIPDLAMIRGGCRVQSSFGEIDATLQARWRQLSTSLGQPQEWS
jgi:flagellar assembly protein FliH